MPAIMSVLSTLVLIFTVLASVFIVSVIILLGWFLIWKAFLSKFRLVRELLGQTNTDGAPYTSSEAASISSGSSIHATHINFKKIRKD